MNRFRKYFKILYVLVISSLMLLACTFTGSATEARKPIIEFDFNPMPIIVTVFMIFALFFGIIALMFFLSKYISESQNRIKRLSKVESEETIQLYDDLEEAKWAKEEIPDDKPIDVLLDDDISKKATASKIQSDAADKEEPRHGPTPERDMPGYDPHAGEEDDAPKPLTPMPTPPTQHISPAQTAAAKAPLYRAPAQQMQNPAYPYTAPSVQPLVYRPDSDVQIIMRDSAAEAPINIASPVVNNSVPEVHSPTKVRAYRRHGKMPTSVQTPAVQEQLVVSEAEAFSTVASVAQAPVIEQQMPRFNMRHLNIGPLGNASVGNDADVSDEQLTYTVNINNPISETEQTPETVREAPVLDPFAALEAEGVVVPKTEEVTVIREPVDYDEEATVEVIPPRRGVNEKIRVELGDEFADAAPMRTLDDVLDELDEDEITEIEVETSPAHEEELIFLGSESLASDDTPEDDVFADEEGEARMFIDGKYTLVRYRTSFMSRFIQSEELYQDYYSVIKNLLLSYEGVTSDIAWSCESFSRGERVCAKVNIRDKMLLLYLALDPERYQNSRYHYTYLYDKYAKYKNSGVAMMVKIKSDRALKYALSLIVDMMAELGAVGGDIKDISYRHAYESTEKLISRGLVKILPYDNPEDAKAEEEIKPELDVADIIENKFEAVPVELEDGAVFDFEEEPEAEARSKELIVDENEEDDPEFVEESVEEPTDDFVQEDNKEELLHEIIHADASEVDKLLSDEEAIESIEIVEDETHIHSGKMDEVNLDSICDVFSDGDVVTIDELKEHRLVSRSAGRVKILARGTMTKTLTIYADKFSLQAVKMITLAGGHAEQYK